MRLVMNWCLALPEAKPVSPRIAASYSSAIRCRRPAISLWFSCVSMNGSRPSACCVLNVHLHLVPARRESSCWRLRSCHVFREGHLVPSLSHCSPGSVNSIPPSYAWITATISLALNGLLRALRFSFAPFLDACQRLPIAAMHLGETPGGHARQ